jgi:hypothetical protein
LGALVPFLSAIPTPNWLRRIVLNLKGTAAANAVAWNRWKFHIDSEFGALACALNTPSFQGVEVDADICFLSFQADVSSGDTSSLAELWACKGGFSQEDGRDLESVFHGLRGRFKGSQPWSVRCICTADTAVWDDSPSDILDSVGLWFDHQAMPPPIRPVGI